MRAVTLDFCQRIGIFRSLFCRRSSPVFLLRKNPPSPQGRVWDTDKKGAACAAPNKEERKEACLFRFQEFLWVNGVIIQGDKITSAGAVFPTSDNLKISKRLGTRHRAALGIAEQTDCIAIIASEETGRLSVAIGGELNYNLTLDEVKLMLLDELRPKKDIIEYEEEEEITDEETE